MFLIIIFSDFQKDKKDGKINKTNAGPSTIPESPEKINKKKRKLDGEAENEVPQKRAKAGSSKKPGISGAEDLVNVRNPMMHYLKYAD